MEKSCFFLALLILLLHSITPCFCAPIFDSATDKHALLSFKNSLTSDPHAILNTNWSHDTSVCDWIGVSCGLKHPRVTALNLSGYDLVGTLPPHLGNLTFLRYLDISFNNFTGFLPVHLSNLHRLRVMNAAVNSFTGEMPTWVGSLPQLQQLILYNNSFSGRIPPSLFNSSKLQKVNLGYNYLSGSIPEEIGSSNSLHTINLRFNHLRGVIPEEIGNISSLEILYLDNNQLRGSIPRGIFNVSSIRAMRMMYNSLSGSLPNDICNNIPRLNTLYLSGNQLSGAIPNIWKCRHLEFLALSFNHFNGNIPKEIGGLKMLRELYLGVNDLRGVIPEEMGNLSRLEILNIQSASLTGNIPSSIFNLSSLALLSFSNNSLSGSIPIMHNVPALVKAYLGNNKFTGELPQGIDTLPRLQTLSVFNNSLSGSIPSSIFNISSLNTLELAENEFAGNLPPDMGNSLSNLEWLLLSWNTLNGPIPTSITNASKLTVLDMSANSLTGSIPDFGNLRFLQQLYLWNNNLSAGEESPAHELTFLSSLTKCRYLNRLEVSDNPFNGILPASIGNFSTSLLYFNAVNNNIGGAIPSGIGNLSSLLGLYVDGNQLSGLIPAAIGKLKQLQEINLDHNQLAGFIPNDVCLLSNLVGLSLSGNALLGPIPECLGAIESLREIYLASNQLNSTIPSKFWALTDLIILNLSSNYFTGQLSPQLGNLKAVNYLDLSFNKFSGYIPSIIDGCKSLEFLNFSNNMFSGIIPQSLGNVRGLTALDFSYNNLSGLIPNSLQHLSFLMFFNVSNNKLEGEIPNGGCFANFSAQSFAHNYALCGPVRFQVPPCLVVHRGSRVKKFARIMVPSLVLAIIVVIVMLLFIRRRKQKQVPVSADTSPATEWRRVSYIELDRGTSCFSETNLLGRGSFGSVFQATLSDGLQVAVKVFNLQVEGAMRSFDTETEILGSIRHRNLVRVIGCCSNMEFKSLILTYMPNGSLEKWLYSNNCGVDLMQRLNIAIDVALALEYLHHGYTFPVVHCDIKPSNVLLDEDMTAHLGDFGIAKLFDGGEVFIQTQTLATIGYAAPEYGMEGKVSTSGDVYSFGIMLLEIFIGKKPVDDMFSEEMSLKEWVSEALQENAAAEIVAPALLSREDQHFSTKEKCVSSIFHLAMKCLASSPVKRINMIEAAASLKKIKAIVVDAGTEIRRRRHHAFAINTRNN